MKTLKSTVFAFSFFALSCASAPTSSTKPAVSQTSSAERLANAKETLKANPNSVAIYARGIVCPSCAIGIRVKMSDLACVDNKRLNGGIKLNAKTQLVTVAIRDGKGVDRDALSLAVRRAGFDPVALFWLNDTVIQREPLAGK